MRCQAHRPGDIVQCERADGHDGPHRAMPRRNSVVHQRQAEPLTWRETWHAPKLKPLKKPNHDLVNWFARFAEEAAA